MLVWRSMDMTTIQASNKHPCFNVASSKRQPPTQATLVSGFVGQRTDASSRDTAQNLRVFGMSALA